MQPTDDYHATAMHLNAGRSLHPAVGRLIHDADISVPSATMRGPAESLKNRGNRVYRQFGDTKAVHFRRLP